MEIRKPSDIAEGFPVRKSKKQKEAFRVAVREFLQSRGYSVSFEKGSFSATNVVVGNPETASYLVTAHYDTCARMIVPNLITPCSLILFLLYQILISVLILAPAFLASWLVGMLTKNFWLAYWVQMILMFGAIALLMIGPANPSNANDNTSGVVTVLEIANTIPENLRDRVCFVLFDLEEAGLLGSSSYQKAHKGATASQIVLNLDCVGEGDLIYLFPTGKLKKDEKRLAPILSVCGRAGEKRIILKKNGFSIYPSDQMQFPYGCGICALKSGRFGPYLSKIHTPRDILLDETNVNILRAALISLIGSTAVE